MADSELLSQVRSFPARLGILLLDPKRALAAIETAGRGGFSLMLMWCLAAALALRFTDLADAVAGYQAGGGMRIISVLAGELSQAIPIALGAALVIVVLAGARREPSSDLELGCATAIPFLALRAFFRTAILVSGGGNVVSSRATLVLYVLGGAWTAVVLGLAVRMARGRPVTRLAEASAPKQRVFIAGGYAALCILAIGFVAEVGSTLALGDRLGPLKRGSPAPQFTLPRIDGPSGSVTLSALRGQVVVVDFWATWCPPCKEMLPTLQALHTEFAGQGVAFVGVESDGEQTSADEVRAFLRTHGVGYPIVHDTGTANQDYRVKVLPTLVVVGKSGNVHGVFVGLTMKSTLKNAIAEARAAAAP